MNCPVCAKEMDIINQTPHAQVNVCFEPTCPMYDEPVFTENEEYEARILPKG
jgi:hypothetical protein